MHGFGPIQSVSVLTTATHRVAMETTLFWIGGTDDSPCCGAD